MDVIFVVFSVMSRQALECMISIPVGLPGM